MAMQIVRTYTNLIQDARYNEKWGLLTLGLDKLMIPCVCLGTDVDEVECGIG